MRNWSNFNTYQTPYKYNTPIPEKTIYKNSVKLLLASSIGINVPVIVIGLRISFPNVCMWMAMLCSDIYTQNKTLCVFRKRFFFFFRNLVKTINNLKTKEDISIPRFILSLKGHVMLMCKSSTLLVRQDLLRLALKYATGVEAMFMSDLVNYYIVSYI